MYIIYWLINKNFNKTYIGFSNRLQERLKEHKNKKVKSTKNFGKFKVFFLEQINTIKQARIREKYWKSGAGRKKLKNYLRNIKDDESNDSSSG